MELSVEQKLAINMKVAHDMGLNVQEVDGQARIQPANGVLRGFSQHFNIFDPEKGDINKAIEFYGIDVVKTCGEWEATGPNYYGTRADRAEVIIKAVTAASGANQTKEDE